MLVDAANSRQAQPVGKINKMRRDNLRLLIIVMIFLALLVLWVWPVDTLGLAWPLGTDPVPAATPSPESE